MSTALTLYGVPSFATTLSTATNAIANTSGASSLGHDTSIGSHTGYGELYPQGNTGTWPALGSLPASPSGNGYLFDVVSLEGNTIAAGNWTPTVRLRVNGGTGGVTADLYVRAYKRSSSGVYTLIGTMQLLAQSIANGTSANYTFAATSLPAMAFTTGDKLYYDVWANITSAASGAANLRLDLSSSTSQGSTNDQLVTPGYDVTPTGTQHTLNTSGRFTLTLPHASTRYGSGRFVSAVRRTRDAAGRFRMRAPRTRFGSGRFVLFATPPPPLAAVAGSTFVPIMQNPKVGGVPTFDQRIDDRATGSFVVFDQGMNYNLSENQRISISDTAASRVLYTGFVDQVVDQLIETTVSVQNMRTVTLKDLRWLAEKKMATTDYAGWTAGDIAAELHRTLLASEGLTAPYALRHDMDATSFGQGTLTNVSASGGVLTLAKAGSDFAKAETSTADFAAGTLTNVIATNNSVTLTSHLAIKAIAYCNGYQGNNYCYQEIWAGDYVVASGDFLTYSIWIGSTSPALLISIDGRCSDGNSIGDYAPSFPHQIRDQNGLWSSPLQDLSGYAKDMWYTRTIDLTLLAGKHLKNLSIGFEGDSQGQYSAYFHDVLIKNGAAVKLTVFTSSLNVGGYIIRNLGYSSQKNVTGTSVVTAYDQAGTRISPAMSLSGVGIIKLAQQSWVMRALPVGTQLTFSTSIDNGVTWQVQANNVPMDGMMAGANTSGLSLLTRQDLAITGPDPTLAPVLDAVTVGVTSAAAMTKTDALYTKTSTADFAAGTLTNVIATNGNVTLNGAWRTWDTKSLSGQTLFGNGANALQGTPNQVMSLAASASTDAKSRFDFAGTWQILDMAVDVQIEVNANVAAGLVWATTGWQGNNDTYAYSATISQTQLLFAKGTNSSSGTGSFTQLASFVFPTAFAVGDMHQLRVQWNGSTHSTTIYVDGTAYITSSDASFSSAGNVGVRVFNGDTVWHDGHFNNFSIVGTYTNTVYKTANMSLAGVGTYGDSRLFWDMTVPALSSVLVETTIDGGASWQVATNDTPIPGLVAGASLSGVNLQMRFTLSEGVGQNTILAGLTAWVIGQYASSGSRIAPVLDATPAGTVGSSSITWQAVTPPGTSAFVDSSTDGTTFTNVPTSGGPVAGLTAQGALWWDTFDSDSSASYTYTAGSWLWDISNSRLVTQGTTFTDLLLTGLSTADVEVYVITNQIQDMSILLRQAASNNRYTLPMSDTSGISGGNIDLHRVTPGGGDVLVAHGAITFVRGTYHAIRVTLAGSTFNVYFDGTLLYTYTDPTPITGPGSVGLNRGTGTSYVNDLAIRPLGVSASGKSIYTKVRLTSSDPLQTPSVPDLLASVRGPALATGAVIPQTQHAYKDSVAAFYDDIAKQSNLSWRFNESYQFSMTDRFGTFAPFVIATANQNIDGVTAPPTVTRFSPLYRNKQYITGAVDLATVTEPKIGDGVTQSWGLSYPVEVMQSIMLNGVAQSFGVQGVDTGRVFYYQQGSNTLTVDASLTPPASTFTITYTGQVPYRAMDQDTGQQAILAALDGSSGIIERSEDAPGLTRAAADALAAARITQYARLSLDWKFITQQNGLAPGQLLTVIVPEHGLNDLQFLITDVSAAVYADINGTLLYWNTITTTTGPSLGNWSRKLQAALLQNG